MKKSIKALSLVLVLVLLASCFVLAACNKKDNAQPTLGAYTLSDKGTFLSYKKNAEGDKVPNLEILFEQADDMKNIYSMEAIVPKGGDTKKDTSKGEVDDTAEWKRTINTKGADSFIHWMSTADTRTLIANYGKTQYGEALFTLIDDASVVYAGTVEKYDKDSDTKIVYAQTTSSVKDSGLLVYLEPLFEAATGFDLQVAAAATGTAIANAKKGDADLILVHSKASEKEFIDTGLTRTVSGIANNAKSEAGYESRITFMYNYFVIVGPASDPAGVKGSTNAAAAFAKIAATKCNFVSRVDASGTYNQEIKLWGAAGITDISWDKANSLPIYNQDYTWYIAAKSKMGECLIKANETYTK